MGLIRSLIKGALSGGDDNNTRATNQPNGGAPAPYGGAPPPAPYGGYPAPYGAAPAAPYGAPAPYGGAPPPAPYPAPYGAAPAAPYGAPVVRGYADVEGKGRDESDYDTKYGACSCEWKDQ